jgi:hypothetical protein
VRPPQATLKPVPRTASVADGVSTWKSLVMPTAATLKAAAPAGKYLRSGLNRGRSSRRSRSRRKDGENAVIEVAAARTRVVTCAKFMLRVAAPFGLGALLGHAGCSPSDAKGGDDDLIAPPSVALLAADQSSGLALRSAIPRLLPNGAHAVLDSGGLHVLGDFGFADGVVVGPKGAGYVVKTMERELLLHPVAVPPALDPAQADARLLSDGSAYRTPAIGPVPMLDESPAVVSGEILAAPRG